MKRSVILPAALFTAAACHSRQPTIYASNEGVRIAAQPPLFRPARATSTRLLSAQRARLVVQTQAGFAPAAASVVVEGIRPLTAHVVKVSNAAGLADFDSLEAGTYAVTARRVGLEPAAVHVVVARGFADTVVLSLGQP